MSVCQADRDYSKFLKKVNTLEFLRDNFNELGVETGLRFYRRAVSETNPNIYNGCVLWVKCGNNINTFRTLRKYMKFFNRKKDHELNQIALCEAFKEKNGRFAAYKKKELI